MTIMCVRRLFMAHLLCVLTSSDAQLPYDVYVHIYAILNHNVDCFLQPEGCHHLVLNASIPGHMSCVGGHILW